MAYFVSGGTYSSTIRKQFIEVFENLVVVCDKNIQMNR